MRQHILAATLAVVTAVLGFPQTDDWRRLMDEGEAAQTAGDYARAASSFRAATEIAERFDHRDRRRALSWNELATIYDAMGRFADAESGYRRALREAAESIGKTGMDYALVLGNLGATYVETGQAAAGEKMLSQALAIYSAADPPNELRIATTQNALAEVLTAGRKYKEADPYLTSALAVLEKAGDRVETALALNNLGVVRRFEGRLEEGTALLVRALTMMEGHFGGDHPMLVRILNNLASLEYRTGHREEAGERLRRALDIAERRLGREHPVYAVVLRNYAAFLSETGDKSRAKALKAQATEILRENSQRNGLDAVIDVNSLLRK